MAFLRLAYKSVAQAIAYQVTRSGLCQSSRIRLSAIEVALMIFTFFAFKLITLDFYFDQTLFIITFIILFINLYYSYHVSYY